MTTSSTSSASIPSNASPAAMNSSAGAVGFHLGCQPYRGVMAGIVQAARAGCKRRATKAESLRNPARKPGLQFRDRDHRSRKTTAATRLGAALALGCLLAALLAATRPGSADSAPVRVVVLGQTATTPPPACPGKIVNGVPGSPAGSRAT